MHRRSQYRVGLRARLRGAWDILSGAEDYYGAHWGDPEKISPLKWVRDQYILSYARSGSVIVEIGPGGEALDPLHAGCGKDIRGCPV